MKIKAACSACDCLREARSKISTLVVGIDFYTTSFPFLESFLSVVRIGKALQGGTFHPKLYLFGSTNRFCCILGSSNFTHGGFANNAELNICVEGMRSDPFLLQVRSFSDEQEENFNPSGENVATH